MTDHEYWRSKGLCVECHCKDAYTLQGRAMCAECARRAADQRAILHQKYGEKDNQRIRSRYQRYKEEHRCVKCGVYLDENETRVRCQRCALKQSIHDRQMTIWKPTRGDCGICYMCNRNPVIEGRKCCAECYPKLRENMLKAKAVEYRNHKEATQKRKEKEKKYEQKQSERNKQFS